MILKLDKLKASLTERDWAAIATGILSNLEAQSAGSLLITSCHEGEGKTFASLNMALTFASRLKRRTLLVDANPISPCVHRLFDLEAAPGLTDLMMDKAEPEWIIQVKPDDNLAILPIGSQGFNWLEWDSIDRLHRVMQQLGQRFETIIADGSSVFSKVDASVYSRSFDAVLLVIECERTRREVVNASQERLKGAGGHLLGTVLNRRKYYVPQSLL
jgi:capsular exopolysaccharide synthesis family protein